MLDKLNEKLLNLNQYLTLKNIALATAAAVAVVCAYKKYRTMWLRNEAQKMANGMRQLPAPQTHGMGNSMVVGPSPNMQTYAAMQRQQTQVPQRMPQGQTTPPVIMPAGQGSWEANALRRHMERLEAENRKLKAQAQGFPSMSTPDSVDEKGNPIYFED
jgi:hypothetical protein